LGQFEVPPHISVDGLTNPVGVSVRIDRREDRVGLGRREAR
jgi:hypothetical protein